MTTPTLLLIPAVLLGLLPMAGHAQQKEDAALLQIRAVWFDPVHPAAELFVMDPTGVLVRLKLIAEGLSEAQATQLANGSLVLYHSATADPAKPAANLAATVKVPAETRRAIVIVLPGPPDSKPAFRMVLINDSAAAFPMGESRVLSLVHVATAIEAGEHKLAVKPGTVVQVPAVHKVNEFNLAQTNFYYRENAAWVAFTERQLQYLDAFRRVFIIHATPGATEPSVTTVIDTAPAALPH